MSEIIRERENDAEIIAIQEQGRWKWVIEWCGFKLEPDNRLGLFYTANDAIGNARAVIRAICDSQYAGEEHRAGWFTQAQEAQERVKQLEAERDAAIKALKGGAHE